HFGVEALDLGALHDGSAGPLHAGANFVHVPVCLHLGPRAHPRNRKPDERSTEGDGGRQSRNGPEDRSHAGPPNGNVGGSSTRGARLDSRATGPGPYPRPDGPGAANPEGGRGEAGLATFHFLFASLKPGLYRQVPRGHKSNPGPRLFPTPGPRSLPSFVTTNE